MMLNTVLSIGSFAVCLVTVAAYWGTKIKDAQDYGKLLQRVDTLEKQQCKAEEATGDISKLVTAVALLTDGLTRLEKKVDELSKEIKELRE